MLSTKNIPHNIEHIPSEWMFEFYCNLDFKLQGQSVMVNSFFNSENVPSMRIYVFSGRYIFKDFSSGKSGSGLKLVSELFNLSPYDASKKILKDYEEYTRNNDYQASEYVLEKYKLAGYKTRGWNKYDIEYWLQYKISSTQLDLYNVKALESVTYDKYINNEKVDSFEIKRGYMYGYFKNDGTLYKVYNPKKESKKFMKLEDYLQGSEQISNKDLLIITSSLKDIMCLHSLEIDADFIAPHSENTMIEDNVINVLKNKYKRVITLFDNDKVGYESGLKYKDKFDIKPIILPLSKDPSDSVKDYGKKLVRNTLLKLL